MGIKEIQEATPAAPGWEASANPNDASAKADTSKAGVQGPRRDSAACQLEPAVSSVLVSTTTEFEHVMFMAVELSSQKEAADLVCDDYSIVNAPFSGSLAGPVSWKDPAGNQYDGVKLVSDDINSPVMNVIPRQSTVFQKVHCVKVFNIRPYHYTGPVAQGEAFGYVLPLQERLSGITSHLELQMCDFHLTSNLLYDFREFNFVIFPSSSHSCSSPF